MANGFDDSAWQTGLAGLGYEEDDGPYEDIVQTELPNGTQAVYARIPFTVTDPDAVMGTLSLNYDDGFVAYLNGVEIARANAPTTLAYDSAATFFHPREAAAEDSVFNVSTSSHLLQLGANVLAIHVMDSPDSPKNDLLIAPTLTISSGSLLSPSEEGVLFAPTPGAPNSDILAGGVTYSQAGGVFAAPFDLTLTPTVPGETIRYTLDGAEPGPSSLLYSAPIAINATTHVRARAVDVNGRLGPLTSAVFTQADASVSSFTSDLPIVVVENFGQGTPNREFLDAALSLYEVESNTGRSSFSGEASLTSSIGHRRRGSSTYSQAKPNLRVEFRDETGGDRDVELLDMPADSDWILYAPYHTDRSLIRNAFWYDLSSQLGNYSVRTRFVEVYFNRDGGVLGESDYMGVYVLMENVKVGEERIDIDPLTPADNSGEELTGGYLFKLDRSDGAEDSSWDTPRGSTGPSRFVHVSPERSEMTQTQVDYLRDYIGDFESAVTGPNRSDPELGYQAYIDVESWIDHHLMRVFSRETDAIVLSEHIYKPRNGKLEFGPVWDFDRSAGSEGSGKKNVDGWDANVANVFGYGWWGRLFPDLDFRQQWVDRWQELRSTIYTDQNLTDTVYRQSSLVDEAQARDAIRWPDTAPNGGDLASPELSGWEAEIDHLVEWLTARAAWIDSVLTAPPLVVLDPSGQDQGQTLLTLSSSVGGDPPPIYYTLDGSDPRADGGGVSSSAVLYTGPVLLSGSTTVKARATGTGWLRDWSSLASDSFIAEKPADATNLRISEFHYNPLDPTSTELLVAPEADSNSFEFIELVNIGTQAINLSGVRFTDGVDFDFQSSGIQVLAPGQVVLVVQDQIAFEARYGAGLPIAGEYEGRLSGGGEDIVLLDGSNATIHDFEYDDDSPWPATADGDGPSVEAVDLLGDYTQGTNWKASDLDHGTPGVAGTPLVGDYDRSGTVDGLDYSVWRAQYGDTVASPGMGADGNRDGVVDSIDYAVWRENLGQSIPVPAVTVAASEPLAPAPKGEARTGSPAESSPSGRSTVENVYAQFSRSGIDGRRAMTPRSSKAIHVNRVSPSAIDDALLQLSAQADSISGPPATSIPVAVGNDTEINAWGLEESEEAREAESIEAQALAPSRRGLLSRMIRRFAPPSGR